MSFFLAFHRGLIDPHPTNITAGFITIDLDRNLLSNVTSNMDVIYHALTFWEPVLFSEELGTDAGWGTLYYAMKNVSNDSSLPSHCIQLLIVHHPGEQHHVLGSGMV